MKLRGKSKHENSQKSKKGKVENKTVDNGENSAPELLIYSVSALLLNTVLCENVSIPEKLQCWIQ